MMRRDRVPDPKPLKNTFVSKVIPRGMSASSYRLVTLECPPDCVLVNPKIGVEPETGRVRIEFNLDPGEQLKKRIAIFPDQAAEEVVAVYPSASARNLIAAVTIKQPEKTPPHRRGQMRLMQVASKLWVQISGWAYEHLATLDACDTSSSEAEIVYLSVLPKYAMLDGEKCDVVVSGEKVKVSTSPMEGWHKVLVIG